VYLDPGCTGTPGTTRLYPPVVAQTVVQGQTLCFVVVEAVPANAAVGDSISVPVQAVIAYSNAGPALSATYTVTDVTTADTAVLGLSKLVRNITQSGALGTSNAAKPGDTLEYQITYTNNSSAPLSGLVISDATPPNTTFVSATAGTLPTSLSACTMNTPVNALPAVAVSCTPAQTGTGAGPIRWGFTGALTPSASGTVIFRITVN
jgi:uncharacterized repeat protein (TIGR01451 family)